MGGLARGGLLSIASNLIQGTLTLAGSIIPSVNNTFSLGSAAMQWANANIAALIDGNSVTRWSRSNGNPTIYRGASAASGVGHEFGNSTTLTGNGRIVNWHNDTTMASAEAYLDCNGQLVQGAGTGSPASCNVGGALSVNSTGVGNVGASGPDDLQTFSLPANTLVLASRGLKIRAWGTTTNNANAKTVRLVFGGTTVITKQLTASIAGFWEIEAVVLRTGTSAQDIFARATNFGGTTVSSTDGATVAMLSTVTTATETETSAIDIKTVSTVSTADNDIISQGLVVEYL